MLSLVTLGILLASCSSSKNSVFIKRRYNKGYYIEAKATNNNSHRVSEQTVSKNIPQLNAVVLTDKTLADKQSKRSTKIERKNKNNAVEIADTAIKKSKQVLRISNEFIKRVDFEIKTEKQNSVEKNNAPVDSNPYNYGLSFVAQIAIYLLCILLILLLLFALSA